MTTANLKIFKLFKKKNLLISLKVATTIWSILKIIIDNKILKENNLSCLLEIKN